MKYPKDSIKAILKEVENPELKERVIACYTHYSKQMLRSPSSIKLHHNWKGGLHDHNYEVMNIATNLYKQYKQILPAVSIDDVIICAFLHDFEKLHRYDWDDIEAKPIKRKINLPPEGVKLNYLGPKGKSDLKAYDARRVKYIENMIKEFFQLTPLQRHAIALSSGGYSSIKGEQTNLSVLIHAADSLSTFGYHVNTLYKKSGGEIGKYNIYY